MPDSPIVPSQTNQTTNSTYPGVGTKKPQIEEEEETKADDSTTGSNVKSKYGKKPPKPNAGTHADANYGSAGAVSAGATSMGTKSEDFWDGPAFAKK